MRDTPKRWINAAGIGDFTLMHLIKAAKEPTSPGKHALEKPFE